MLILTASLTDGEQLTEETRIIGDKNQVADTPLRPVARDERRDERSFPLAWKSILKGANYDGLVSETKIYSKHGNKGQATANFFTLNPTEVDIRDGGKFMRGNVNGNHVYLSLRPPVVLLLQGQKVFREIRYKQED